MNEYRYAYTDQSYNGKKPPSYEGVVAANTLMEAQLKACRAMGKSEAIGQYVKVRLVKKGAS